MACRRALLLIAAVFIPFSSVPAEVQDLYALFGESIETRSRNTGLTIFPTLIIPSGGEFEGMGTAYTAVARDASFFDANPAASATLEYTELAFIHNNWIADSYVEGIAYTVRDDFLGFGVGGKFLHVGFDRYSPSSQTAIDPVTGRTASGLYTEGMIGFNIAYNFMESYDFHGVAVGANLKAAYRTIPDYIAPDQNALGLMADIGVLTRFDLWKFYATRSENFSVGFSLRNFGLPVRGEGLPSSANIGLAYQPIRPVLVATDVSLPLNFAAGDPAEPIGFAGGVSVAVTPFFSAHSGLLLRAGGPRFTLGADTDLEGVSIAVNYSLDLSSRLAVFNRLSVQARLNFGDRGRGALRDRVDRLYFDAWLARTEGDLPLAIELLQEALQLDYDFRPAIVLLRLAERELELQEQLQRIETGEIENF